MNGALPVTGALHVLEPTELVYTVTPGLSRDADIATDTTEVDTGVTITPAGAEKGNTSSIFVLLVVCFLGQSFTICVRPKRFLFEIATTNRSW